MHAVLLSPLHINYVPSTKYMQILRYSFFVSYPIRVGLHAQATNVSVKQGQARLRLRDAHLGRPPRPAKAVPEEGKQLQSGSCRAKAAAARRTPQRTRVAGRPAGRTAHTAASASTQPIEASIDQPCRRFVHGSIRQPKGKGG